MPSALRNQAAQGPVWIDIPKDVQTAVFEIETQPAMAEKAAAPPPLAKKAFVTQRR